MEYDIIVAGVGDMGSAGVAELAARGALQRTRLHVRQRGGRDRGRPGLDGETSHDGGMFRVGRFESTTAA